MRRIAVAAALLLAFQQEALAATEDVLLRKAIAAYQVRPLTNSAPQMGPKEILGQALFFDPFVSGPKSIACGACHVRSLGAADGLPMAVGLGPSRGIGSERLNAKTSFVVPRNALPFFNRGVDGASALFWDGRVQLGPDGRFESPLGRRLPDGFDSLLAVAAVFPPAEPDEMLGRSKERVGLVAYHAELLGPEVDANDLQERTLAVFNSLIARLLAPASKTTPDDTVAAYRSLFRAAYPGIELSGFGIQHVGNALAAYIAAAFALQPAAWDRYVLGNQAALTQDQKRGALIFYGKGRCAVCHAGTHFSDSRFHGLAIPQPRIGKHTSYVDYGRAAATSRGEDRFTFRTPPLRNVTETAPYGHNGMFATLPAVISHHGNPIPALYETQKAWPESAPHAGRLLGFRSPILAEMAPLSTADVDLLVSFLGSLTSRPLMPDSMAFPRSVPSGDMQFVRR